MGHTGLVTDEGGHVDGFLGVVTGEGSNATELTAGALTGEETERTVTRSFKFTMRLIIIRWMYEVAKDLPFVPKSGS